VAHGFLGKIKNVRESEGRRWKRKIPRGGKKSPYFKGKKKLFEPAALRGNRVCLKGGMPFSKVGRIDKKKGGAPINKSLSASKSSPKTKEVKSTRRVRKKREKGKEQSGKEIKEVALIRSNLGRDFKIATGKRNQFGKN